jgi:hypothetical protein
MMRRHSVTFKWIEQALLLRWVLLSVIPDFRFPPIRIGVHSILLPFRPGIKRKKKKISAKIFFTHVFIYSWLCEKDVVSASLLLQASAPILYPRQASSDHTSPLEGIRLQPQHRDNGHYNEFGSYEYKLLRFVHEFHPELLV